MERTCGRRFRCRYAALIEVSTGPSLLPVRTTRHCRYRAFGLVIADPVLLVYADDHALHVASGVSVLPDRVNTSTFDPAGVVACQPTTPQVEIICASRASDS